MNRKDDGQGECPNVLLVEDDNIARRWIRRLMDASASSYRLDEAVDGLAALEMITARLDAEAASETSGTQADHEGLPEIVLLDLMLPRMHGLEFLQEIGQLSDKHPNLKKLKVIAITESDDPRLASECREHKIVRHMIRKFPRPETLLPLVDSLLAEYEQD